MALPADTMAATSIRAKHSKVLTNGVSVLSPMWYLITMGLQKGRKDLIPSVENWRGDIQWNQGGKTCSWDIVTHRSTAEHNQAALRNIDFEEVDLLDTASVSRYNVERSWAISEGDAEANKNDDTKLQDIRKIRRQDAQDSINARLVQIPHQSSETNQNGGLSMFSPTNAGNGTTYAGIAMNASSDSNYYWRPTGYDYGALTLAANYLAIFDSVRRQLQVSKTAGGGGGIVNPDFAVFPAAAWTHFITFVTSKMQINVHSGDRPQNYNMFQTGFDNVEILGVTMFPDSGFGASNGYIDAVAAEEFLMGHSSKIKLSTTASKGSFISALPTVSKDPRVTGELGRYRTGLFALYFESPKFFQLSYT